MSFILDALKKSETERQRADAPALYEMKMAPPRQGVATWLIVLAALLLLNIVVLAVVLLRGSHGAAPQPDATSPATPPPAATPPAPALPAASTQVYAAAPAPVPVPAPTVPPPAAGPAQDPNAPDVTTAAPATASTRNPSDDDAPAVEPPRTRAQYGAQAGATAAGNDGELPTYQQAAAAPGSNLPELALNLHSYSRNPADRFVFLNMTKLREGQVSPQGVRVETITPDGAILSWQGSKFMLQRQ